MTGDSQPPTDNSWPGRTILVADSARPTDRPVVESLVIQQHQAHLCLVTYTNPSADLLAKAVTAREATDTTVTVIQIGDVPTPPTVDGVELRSISAAGDLTSLGIEIGEVLDRGPVVLGLDSLTTMLQYVNERAAFEFLHTITGQIRATGSHAVVHINRDAHDDQLLEQFSVLFDARVDDRGEAKIRPSLAE